MAKDTPDKPIRMPFNRAISIQSPCFCCQKRESGCHGKCDAYKDYKAALARIYEQRKAHMDYIEAKADSIQWSVRNAPKIFQSRSRTNAAVQRLAKSKDSSFYGAEVDDPNDD